MYRLSAEGLAVKQRVASAQAKIMHAEGRAGSGHFKNHPYPESAKKKGSDSVRRAIAEGRLNPGANIRKFVEQSIGTETYWKTRNWLGKHGSIFSEKNGRDIFYDSSWELKRIMALEASDKVLSYRKNPVRIPYSLNGKAHYYVPDFLIEFTNGVHVLEEIKPEWALTRPDVQQKFAAARMFCDAQRIVFQVISNDTELNTVTIVE